MTDLEQLAQKVEAVERNVQSQWQPLDDPMTSSQIEFLTGHILALCAVLKALIEQEKDSE